MTDLIEGVPLVSARGGQTDPLAGLAPVTCLLATPPTTASASAP